MCSFDMIYKMQSIRKENTNITYDPNITSWCIFFNRTAYRHAYININNKYKYIYIFFEGSFLLILTKTASSCLRRYLVACIILRIMHCIKYSLEICWLSRLAFYIQTAEFLNDSHRGCWLRAFELLPLNQWLTNRVFYQGNELVDH